MTPPTELSNEGFDVPFEFDATTEIYTN